MNKRIILVCIIIFILMLLSYCDNQESSDTSLDKENTSENPSNQKLNEAEESEALNLIKSEAEEMDITNNSDNGIVKKGDLVSVHYLGTLENGEKFDSSYDRGEALQFQVGAGQMISGFDKGVEGMKQGEKKKLELSPEEAYGYPDDKMIVSIPLEKFGNIGSHKIGEYITVQTQNGPAQALIHSLTDTDITLNFNHRLAGKSLIFEVELMKIERK